MIFLNRYHNFLICFGLIVLILTAYWNVPEHDFIHYDDDEYVIYNARIKAGITLDSITWAFTSGHAANWHPLTWLSHMIDYQLYGLNPRGHHVTNILFHIVNSLLLFFFLKIVTMAPWRSGLVAVLFAIHPVHVESVAWVAERKDVLSTFFLLSTLWAYYWYVQKKDVIRYFLVAISFALGLMAKPMLVSVPIVLLLLDYWPLNRFSLQNLGKDNDWHGIGRIIVEKLPLFILTGISSVITVIVQQHGGAVQSIEKYPVLIRLMNALVAYVGYIWKMIWPIDLAIIYPHPGYSIGGWQAAGAFLILIVTSALVIRLSSSRPYLVVGWFWYLVTLLPVIGLIQVGFQAMADRYTYIPLIGLFIAVSWGMPILDEEKHVQQNLLVVVVFVVLLILTAGTRHQTRYWKNSESLFQHALKVTSDNYVAYEHLGIVSLRKGDYERADTFFKESLSIKPDHYPSSNNLGYSLLRQGKIDEAVTRFKNSLSVKPEYVSAHNNLGLALGVQGKFAEAIEHYKQALKFGSENEYIHDNLGVAYLKNGSPDLALKHFYEAVRLNPKYAEAYFDLGSTLYQLGRKEEGREKILESLELKPDFEPARNFLNEIK